MVTDSFLGTAFFGRKYKLKLGDDEEDHRDTEHDKKKTHCKANERLPRQVVSGGGSEERARGGPHHKGVLVAAKRKQTRQQTTVKLCSNGSHRTTHTHRAAELTTR